MIVRCGNCGTKNRIPADRIGQTGRCGSCGKPVSAPALPDRPVDLHESDFERVVASYPVPVLVDFYSNTCGPCMGLVPVLERVAAARQGRIVIAKINVEANPRLAARFGVRGVPSLVLMRDGREADRLVGAPSEQDMFRWVDARL